MHLREKQIFKKIVLSCPFDLFNAEQAAFNDFVAHSNLEFGYIAGLQLIISMYLLFFSFKIASIFYYLIQANLLMKFLVLVI